MQTTNIILFGGCASYIHYSLVIQWSSLASSARGGRAPGLVVVFDDRGDLVPSGEKSAAGSGGLNDTGGKKISVVAWSTQMLVSASNC